MWLSVEDFYITSNLIIHKWKMVGGGYELAEDYSLG